MAFDPIPKCETVHEVKLFSPHVRFRIFTESSFRAENEQNVKLKITFPMDFLWKRNSIFTFPGGSHTRGRTHTHAHGEPRPPGRPPCARTDAHTDGEPRPPGRPPCAQTRTHWENHDPQTAPHAIPMQKKYNHNTSCKQDEHPFGSPLTPTK